MKYLLLPLLKFEKSAAEMECRGGWLMYVRIKRSGTHIKARQAGVTRYRAKSLSGLVVPYWILDYRISAFSCKNNNCSI